MDDLDKYNKNDRYARLNKILANEIKEYKNTVKQIEEYRLRKYDRTCGSQSELYSIQKTLILNSITDNSRKELEIPFQGDSNSGHQSSRWEEIITDDR